MLQNHYFSNQDLHLHDLKLNYNHDYVCLFVCLFGCTDEIQPRAIYDLKIPL